jgi:hypothetical protein
LIKNVCEVAINLIRYFHLFGLHNLDHLVLNFCTFLDKFSPTQTFHPFYSVNREVLLQYKSPWDSKPRRKRILVNLLSLNEKTFLFKIFTFVFRLETAVFYILDLRKSLNREAIFAPEQNRDSTMST